MTTIQTLVDSYVSRAVREFGENPLGSKLLRRLADELPAQFCLSALQQLEQGGEPGAFRLLINLVLQQPDLLEQICNPEHGSRQRSVAIVQQILTFDPYFDLCLARKLPDRSGTNHPEAYHGARAFRILEILDEVSPGRRLLPVLAHLVSSDDKKLSSRATLYVGRRVKSAKWAARLLRHSDQRVGASAIESIWGLRTPEAIRFLESALDDTNNRVVGNAVLGLHIAEVPGVEELVARVAGDPRPEFRATAAWVMGRMAGAEWAPELNCLMKDESALVRSTALRALIEVRRYEAKTQASLAALAKHVSEQETMERVKALAEILEPVAEPEFVPAPIEIRLDGQSYAFKRP